MTKFRDGFMMKSPLPKHQKEFYDEAERLSKESGTPGDYDRDNPEVRKQLDKAEEAEKSHNSDSAAKMKSPLDVTATQAITSDMYYQPREEMDYSTMIAAAGDMGAKSARKQAKKDCEDSERTYTETEDEEGKITSSCN